MHVSSFFPFLCRLWEFLPPYRSGAKSLDDDDDDDDDGGGDNNDDNCDA